MLEKIKNKIRLLLPVGMQNRVSLFPKYINMLGLTYGIRNYLATALTKKGLVKIIIRGYQAPIYLRPNTSDIKIFEQIFVSQDYALPIKISPNFIIDGGANIGLASVFFRKKYPNATILAIEPEKTNCDILRKNLKFYNQIKIIEAGLWPRNGFLLTKDKQVEHAAFQTIECKEKPDQNDGVIKAITLSSILEEFNYPDVDILKLDIEGAEREVFSDYKDWLHKVNLLIVELHGESTEFEQAISHNNYLDFSKGENTILCRSDV